MYIYVYTCTITDRRIRCGEMITCLLNVSGFLLQAVEFETSVHASGSQELSMFTESHAGHQTRVIYKRHGKETNKTSAQNIAE